MKARQPRKKVKITTWRISENLHCGMFGAQNFETTISFNSQKPMNKTTVKALCKLLNFQPYKINSIQTLFAKYKKQNETKKPKKERPKA